MATDRMDNSRKSRKLCCYNNRLSAAERPVLPYIQDVIVA